jgi:acyl-CoA thioester hydrolase
VSDAVSGPQRALPAWRDGWYVVPWDVTFRDVDVFGHVNNAVYFSYFEWARTRYWLDLLGLSKADDIGFIVARGECDFRRQIEMEPIEILVRIGEMRDSSLDFVYEIRKTRGDVLAASGKVVVVLFDWTARAKTPITEELREKVKRFQQR